MNKTKNIKKMVVVNILIVIICMNLYVTSYGEKYIYDNLNRVTEIYYDDGSYVKYEYDNNGNITKISTGKNKVNNEEKENTNLFTESIEIETKNNNLFVSEQSDSGNNEKNDNEMKKYYFLEDENSVENTLVFNDNVDNTITDIITENNTNGNTSSEYSAFFMNDDFVRTQTTMKQYAIWIASDIENNHNK